jgi:hypothetical protein
LHLALVVALSQQPNETELLTNQRVFRRAPDWILYRVPIRGEVGQPDLMYRTTKIRFRTKRAVRRTVGDALGLNTDKGGHLSREQICAL